MRIRLISLAITLLAGLALAPGGVAAPTTFTVDSTGDAADATPGDGDCATSGVRLHAARGDPGDERDRERRAVHDRVRRLADLGAAGDASRRSRGTDVFVDGCGVTRADVPSTDAGPPNPPAVGPCVGLVGTGAPRSVCRSATRPPTRAT